MVYLEGGTPVARQTRRLLHAVNALHNATEAERPPSIFYSTGDANALQSAAQRWLGLHTTVAALSV